MMMKRLLHIVLLAALVLAGSCQKELPNDPKPNRMPSTRLWLSSADTLNETSSRLHAHWYGEDPDGYVKGFLIAVPESASTVAAAYPDTFTYAWTTRNDSIIPLPLLKQRSLFTMVARAVDNTFAEDASLAEGTPVRLVPQPYADLNGNGMYDGGDRALPTLAGAVDRTSAQQLLPIKNTPPTVFFAVNALDSTTVQQPDTTYTVATFSWYANDIDGNNTIASFRIALNDTTSPSRWLTLSSSSTTVTLIVSRTASDAAGAETPAEVYTGTYPTMQYRGTVPGLKLNAANELFLQARDVAGEYSPAVKMPSAPSRKWYVKRPSAKMLFVLDYGVTNNTEKNAVVPYYRKVFASPLIAGGTLAQFDVLDIVNSQPAFLNPALIRTLQLYPLVLWVTNRTPSILPAQVGLFNYTQSGGKVIFSTTFQTAVTYAELKALNDFSPIDSTTSDTTYFQNNNVPPTNADRSISKNVKVLSVAAGYPDLVVDSLNVSGATVSSQTVNMRRIYKRTDSRYIYRIDSSRVSPPRYIGAPDIACIDNDRRFVLFALPLHILNGKPGSLPLFFKQVIENEFGLN